jgi:hypothetical protein
LYPNIAEIGCLTSAAWKLPPLVVPKGNSPLVNAPPFRNAPETEAGFEPCITDIAFSVFLLLPLLAHSCVLYTNEWKLQEEIITVQCECSSDSKPLPTWQLLKA